jgi:hypothetical protein
MKMFNYTRKLKTPLILVSIMLISVFSLSNAHADYPDLSVDVGTQGQFLWKEGKTYVRAANVTMIGSLLVNLLVGVGTTSVGLPGGDN